MNEPLYLTSPLDAETVRSLRAGTKIFLSGTILTGRDDAHLRLCEMLDAGEKLPVDLDGQTIYYVGPCPAPPGHPIGSAGPTTSGRMDPMAPRLIRECGLRAMIGKGNRGPEVRKAMQACNAVYFAATGGAGALIAHCIVKAEVIAFPELGPEAIYRLEIKDLPLVVAIDALGNSLY